MQLGHLDVNNAFEIIWDRVAKKIIHVWEFSFLEGLGCLSLYWKWSQRVRGVARPLNNKSDICGHLSKGKDIDAIAKGKIAIRILQCGILHQPSGNITMWNITSGNITMWIITYSGYIIPFPMIGKFGHHASNWILPWKHFDFMCPGWLSQSPSTSGASI